MPNMKPLKNNIKIITSNINILKLGLLLSEVSNQEKITLSADDLNKAIMNEAKNYPGQEQMVFDYYVRNKEAVESLRAPAFEEKIIDYILSKTNVTNTEVTVAELYNFDDTANNAVKGSKKKTKAA